MGRERVRDGERRGSEEEGREGIHIDWRVREEQVSERREH